MARSAEKPSGRFGPRIWAFAHREQKIPDTPGHTTDPHFSRNPLSVLAMSISASFERRGGDSNSRYPCGQTGFRKRRIQPLCHLSSGFNKICQSVFGVKMPCRGHFAACRKDVVHNGRSKRTDLFSSRSLLVYDACMSDPKDMPILDLVIELGIVRMRASIGPDDGSFYRPRVCLCVDQRSGMILSIELGEPEEPNLQLAVKALERSLGGLKGLPRQVQVRDPKLAIELKDVIGPSGVDVVVRESLPMLDEAIAGMADFGKFGGKPKPALLDVPGMTLDHLIAFAEAAREFYQAKPWQHLLDEDLIAIESPAGPPGTLFTQVLGAAGNTFGLGFVDSRKAHENILAGKGLPRGPVWNLLFGDIDRIPYDDGEIWERYNLPHAGPGAYASFIRHKTVKGFDYPTPDQLIWAEGLLLAIAATTEEELDGGHWEKTVETFNGAAIYTFSMPILLEQMSGSAKTAANRSAQSSIFAMESMQRAMHQ